MIETRAKEKALRILFTTYAEKTHFLGMVPLAWALVCAGHEVRVASQPALTDVITATGLTAVPVGRDHNLYEMMRRLGDRGNRFAFAENRPEMLTWDFLRSAYRNVVPWWFRLVNEPMIDDLVAYCQQWKPDLVLWEPVSYAGPIAATASGAAHGRVMWSVDLFTRMRRHFLRLAAEQPTDQREDPLADWLTARVTRHGGRYDETMTTGQFTIDTVPDSLRRHPGLGLDLDLHYLPMRYVPYNGPSVVPDWLRTPPDRPRVALTLGTSGSSATERQQGRTASAADLLDALADLDVEVVAMLPEAERDRLDPVPGNVRLVSFAPLNVLAPTCAAVVHHGGNGTWCTTLLHGVPQLVLPNMFDLSVRGGWLADRGAGLTLPSGEVTPAAVRHAVDRLLGEPGFAAGAAGLAAEMQALPTPNALVPQIEELTSKHRPATAG